MMRQGGEAWTRSRLFRPCIMRTAVTNREAKGIHGCFHYSLATVHIWVFPASFPVTNHHYHLASITPDPEKVANDLLITKPYGKTNGNKNEVEILPPGKIRNTNSLCLLAHTKNWLLTSSKITSLLNPVYLFYLYVQDKSATRPTKAHDRKLNVSQISFIVWLVIINKELI